MNKKVFSSAAIVWLLALSLAHPADLQVEPVFLTVTGDVSVASTGTPPAPAVAKQAVPVGSEITTKSNSAAAVSVAPGISAALKENTVVRLKAASVSKAERSAEVELVKGRVQCRLVKQGAPKQKYRVNTGPGEWAQAVGTLWQSGSEGNKRHVAVLEGTVVWNALPYVSDISVPAGSVLISKYTLVGGVATLARAYAVNLVDGTTILYYPLEGKDPEVKTATADELQEARDLFNDALGNQLENLKSDNSLFGLINSTLANAGVRGLGPNTGGNGSPDGPPPGGGKGIGLGDATSPITP